MQEPRARKMTKKKRGEKKLDFTNPYSPRVRSFSVYAFLSTTIYSLVVYELELCARCAPLRGKKKRRNHVLECGLRARLPHSTGRTQEPSLVIAANAGVLCILLFCVLFYFLFFFVFFLFLVVFFSMGPTGARKAASFDTLYRLHRNEHPVERHSNSGFFLTGCPLPDTSRGERRRKKSLRQVTYPVNNIHFRYLCRTRDPLDWPRTLIYIGYIL